VDGSNDIAPPGMSIVRSHQYETSNSANANRELVSSLELGHSMGRRESVASVTCGWLEMLRYGQATSLLRGRSFDLAYLTFCLLI
jgi:hypothetical protein